MFQNLTMPPMTAWVYIPENLEETPIIDAWKMAVEAGNETSTTIII